MTDTATFMADTTNFITVTTGDVAARLELLEDGIAFCAPVTYRGVVICDEGRWRYGVAHTDTQLIHQALDDCFIGLFRSAGEARPEAYARLRRARAA